MAEYTHELLESSETDPLLLSPLHWIVHENAGIEDV